MRGVGAAQRRASRLLFYGWYIALAGAATNFLVGGITGFSFGVFIGPIRSDLNWSLAVITIGFSIRAFQSGLLAPVTGLLVDRFGPRRMSVAGIIVTSLGLVLFSRSHQIPTFYISSMVIALGQSLGGFTAFSAAIVHWFQRRRGHAMGIMTMGNGAGYLLAPVLALLIDGIGWRSTLVVAAAAILAAGIPLALVIRDRPEPYGYAPDGDPPEAWPADRAQSAGSSGGMSVAEAVHIPAFYLLTLAITFSGPTQNAWVVLHVPHLNDVGYSLTSAALVTGGYGLVQVPLRFVGGWFADRFGRRRTYILSFLLQGAGLVIFANMDASRPWLLPAFYATYALGHGLYVALFLTLTADYFGVRRYASIQGIVMTAQMPFGVALPVIAGAVFDRTGSYSGIFMIYAAMTTLSALFVLLIRRPTWMELASRRGVEPEAELQPAG